MRPMTKLYEAADKLAVQIVTLVVGKLSNGKLYAYDGIEAAREIRSLIVDQVTAATKLYEFDKEEWWDVMREATRGELSREQYEEAWREFCELKQKKLTH